MNKQYKILSVLYFFQFFSLGTFVPLISQFLINRNFTGSKIGTTLALGSLGMIIIQPLTGYLFDSLNKKKSLLVWIVILTSISSIAITNLSSPYLIMITYLMIRGGFSALLPISDSITLGTSLDFGRIRLWGGVGFAIGAQVSALLAELLGLNVIFYLLTAGCTIYIFVINHVDIPNNHKKPNSKKLSLLPLIKNSDFIILLLASFLIGGSITGFNGFFAVLYKEVGGSITGVGLAFLFFAGSEAPIMWILKKVIERVDTRVVLIFACIMFMARYYWYSTLPSPHLIVIFFIIQGLSIGVYLVISNLIISEVVAPDLRTTALAIYFSISSGVGGMITQYISGKVLETGGIEDVFRFYFYICFVALFLYLLLYFKSFQRKKY